MKVIIRYLWILTLLLVILSCNGKCNTDPDLVIPLSIEGTIFVGQETNYAVVKGLHYPNGLPLYLTNCPNSFYSVTRNHPVTKQTIVFYWDDMSFPPLDPSAPYPFSSLTLNETIYIYKVVHNNRLDLDCLFKGNNGKAGASEASMQSSVHFHDGTLEQLGSERLKLEPIPQGESRLMRFPMKLSERGSYEVVLNVNVGEVVLDERDRSNNTFTINFNF